LLLLLLLLAEPYVSDSDSHCCCCYRTVSDNRATDRDSYGGAIAIANVFITSVVDVPPTKRAPEMRMAKRSQALASSYHDSDGQAYNQHAMMIGENHRRASNQSGDCPADPHQNAHSLPLAPLLVLYNVDIVRNRADHGGGLSLMGVQRIQLSDLYFEYNEARWGGAIFAANEQIFGYVTLDASVHASLNNASYAGDCLALETCLTDNCRFNSTTIIEICAANKLNAFDMGLATSM
jgi:hypothetical protein